MTTVDEVRTKAEYKGITLSCHSKRERVAVLRDGRIVAISKALYDSLKVPVKKVKA